MRKQQVFRWHNQYLGAMILAFLSMDLVVIPWILMPLFERRFWPTFIYGSILATIELFLWFLFWRWFKKAAFPEMLKKKIEQDPLLQQFIEGGKSIIFELRDYGYLDKIQLLFFKTFKSVTNVENKTVKKIKKWGHVFLFFAGWEPWIPTLRTIGVIFCATTGWHSGLITLVPSNILHIATIILGWKFVFWTFAGALSN